MRLKLEQAACYELLGEVVGRQMRAESKRRMEMHDVYWNASDLVRVEKLLRRVYDDMEGYLRHRRERHVENPSSLNKGGLEEVDERGISKRR